MKQHEVNTGEMGISHFRQHLVTLRKRMAFTDEDEANLEALMANQQQLFFTEKITANMTNNSISYLQLYFSRSNNTILKLEAKYFVQYDSKLSKSLFGVQDEFRRIADEFRSEAMQAIFYKHPEYRPEPLRITHEEKNDEFLSNGEPKKTNLNALRHLKRKFKKQEKEDVDELESKSPRRTQQEPRFLVKLLRAFENFGLHHLEQ